MDTTRLRPQDHRLDPKPGAERARGRGRAAAVARTRTLRLAALSSGRALAVGFAGRRAHAGCDRLSVVRSACGAAVSASAPG
jgi:hypothetical protein